MNTNANGRGKKGEKEEKVEKKLGNLYCTEKIYSLKEERVGNLIVCQIIYLCIVSWVEKIQKMNIKA